MARIHTLMTGTAFAALSVGFFTPALAQQEEYQLEEIVVTARKTQETLIKAPVTVSAFTEKAIASLGLTSVEDVARMTPGFNFDKAFGRTTERPVLRGAANILAGTASGAEAGASYFIDGVAYNGDLQAIDMSNITRVEVVKGPQSALYGRNTYAGAINFVTKDPTNDFTASAKVTAAENGEYEASGRVSGALAADILTGALSVRHFKFGGEIVNKGKYLGVTQDKEIGKEESTSVNVTLLFTPVEAIKVRAMGGYVEDNDGPRPFALQKSDFNNCMPGYRSNLFMGTNPGLTTGVNPTSAYANAKDTNNPYQYYCGTIKAPKYATQDLDGTPFLGVKRQMYFGSAKADIEFGAGWAGTLQAGYRTQKRWTGSDSDHQLSPARTSLPAANLSFNTNDYNTVDDHSIEARVNSPKDRRIRAMVGAFNFKLSQEQFQGNFSFGPTAEWLPAFATEKYWAKNNAVFGMIEADIVEHLTATAEVRYAKETKKLVNYNGVTGALATGGGSITTKTTTPKFTLRYAPSDTFSTYVSYAEGNKPGGPNSAVSPDPETQTYREETLKAWEAGVKAKFLDNRVQANLSVFRNKIADYQLTTPIAAPGSSLVASLVTNQGNATIKGFETDFRARITETVMVGGNYSYTDAKFTRGCDDFQYTLTSGGFQMASINIKDPSTWNKPRLDVNGDGKPDADPYNMFTGHGDCSIAGKAVPLVSKHIASAWVNFEQPINSDLTFFLNSDISFQSARYDQVHNLTKFGKATTLGANMGVRGENWELKVFGRNITDADSPTAAVRWFDVLQGASFVPGSGIDKGAFTGPRAHFLAFRKGSQFGVTASMNF